MNEQLAPSTSVLRPAARRPVGSCQINSSHEMSNDDENSINSSDESVESLNEQGDEDDMEEEDEESPCRTPECTRNPPNESSSASVLISCILMVIVACFIAAYWTFSAALPGCDSATLTTFSEDIQIAVEAAVDETNRFNKPSVLTFIYDQQQLESQVDDDLQMIVNYSTCKLHGGSEFVEITSDDVRNPAVISDRGKLISKYTAPLKERKVMVVRHLEEVPPSVAVAFHYFCDEQSPIVKHALFIFTLRHNAASSGDSEFRVVENVLTEKWGELKADLLPPLIARITNAIVRI